MIDLERLIRERQDVLRGRPRDWIDDFGDWRRRIDWINVVGIAVIVVSVLAVVLVLVLP